MQIPAGFKGDFLGYFHVFIPFNCLYLNGEIMIY